MSEVIGPFDQPGGMAQQWGALESTALKNAAQYTANQYQAPLLQNKVTEGNLANQRSSATLPYAGPQAAANLNQTQLANQKSQTLLPFVAPEAQAQLSNEQLAAEKAKALLPFAAPQAQANLSQQILANQKAQAVLPYAAPAAQAAIALQQATANYKNMGGGYGMGVDAKNILQLQRQLMIDDPSLTQEQANKRASAYLSGQTQDEDGNPLPIPSGIAQNYINHAFKSQTTAGLMTKNIQAKQAEAEIQVMSKYANEGTQLAGTTYAGYSPDQLIDSFGSDPASQEKLGKIIGSQAIQYEIAQLRNRMAGGQPGVTATQELMHQSGQLLSTKYPRLTPQARLAASKYINQALEEGLDARLKVGIGAGSANVAPGQGLKKSKADNDPLGIR